MMISKTAAMRRGLVVGRCSPAVFTWTTPSCTNNIGLRSPQQGVIPARCKSSKASPATATSASSSSSLLDSAAQYYASLRWKFATSLTESLPKEQQEELLGRLNLGEKQPFKTSVNAPPAVETAEVQHSIAEAVAAARAEEAKQQKAKFEKEASKLMAEAEAAARARVENELLIQHRRMAFEKWQQEVEREKQQQQQQSQNSTTTSTTNATTASFDEPQQQRQKLMVEEPIAISDHPVLGSAVADFGYKRIHIASIAALKSLPVWKKQRSYRHQRAKAMASDKLKTLHLGMPGIITLHEDVNGKLSIVDGQHRVGMMAILEEKMQTAKDGEEFFNLKRILVEVYPDSKQENDETLYDDNADESSLSSQLFQEINKAEPVKLVDLPGIGLTKSGRKTINEGAKRLEEAFPEMFSASQRCRAPHLNIDNLRDALFASDVLKRHDLNSPKALEAWMLEQNEILKQEYTSEEPSKKAASISKTALEKATKNNFFLGLDSSWLYA